jgi:ABC-type branched-subunit amino acid transport system substrate-binding protein
MRWERRLAATVLALASLALAGCDASGGADNVEGPVRVYVSLPLSGPLGPAGRDAADGARLALQETGGLAGGPEVEARFRDDAGGRRWDPVLVGANARSAAQDSSAVAYIGELESGPTRASLPILNEAGLAQVSPGATAVDLTREAPGVEDSPDRYRPSGEPTLARLVPDDELRATAAARFDDRPEIRVESLLAPQSLPPPGQRFVGRFRRRFDRQPGPHAAYGYEAMQLVLQSIGDAERASERFRSEVVAELLAATRTDTVIGDYSITNEGETTLCPVQPYRGAMAEKPLCAEQEPS